jgi:hypothetical protein
MVMKTVEYIARALALLWAGFWMFFFITESLAWDTPAIRMTIWVCVGFMFVIVALSAWRWEVAGGLMLMAVGVLAAVAYAIWGPRQLALASRLTTILVFGMPPMAAGALFLMHHHGITHPGTPSGAHN